MKFRLIFLILIALLLTLGISGCADPNAIVVKSASGDHRFNVEIADDVSEQMRGLMGRESLEKDAGMIFIFPDEKVRGFWMKDTLIPLDIISIDANFTIIDINKNTQPCSSENFCRIYYSKKPAKYVLEINGGLSDKLGISLGDKVKYPA